MKKGGIILLSICALSLCFVLGLFTGRNLKDDYANLPDNEVVIAPSQTAQRRDYRLDINSATKTQLMELPGIGELIAERIVSYRTENGPFESTDDLMKVEGIGQKKLQQIEHLIRSGG